mmetsp:Transcript_17980/g.36241  ORF Transcript_17980/g.36241 Transcript_17980/m.36241 type:complete len:224 (+) Transcript_17980:87-758(+)
MKSFSAILSFLATSGLAFCPRLAVNSAILRRPFVTSSTSWNEHGASSTSLYTTTEKIHLNGSLDSVLGTKCKDEKVRQVIKNMLDACANISEALRLALVTADAQLSVDSIADNIIWDAVRKSNVVREGASEDDPVIHNVDEGGNGEFTVCWDPIDGSSIVDNNWAVGTMMGSKLRVTMHGFVCVCVCVCVCIGFVWSITGISLPPSYSVRTPSFRQFGQSLLV